MIPGEFEGVTELTASGLSDAYRARLNETVRAVGIERAVTETRLDRETVSVLADGSLDGTELSLSQAATLLALEEGQPDADTVEAEARDLLLMGMSMAVVDVDAVASGLGGDLEPKEIQAKVEGRQPMTLGEYARIHHFIETQR